MAVFFCHHVGLTLLAWRRILTDALHLHTSLVISLFSSMVFISPPHSDSPMLVMWFRGFAMCDCCHAFFRWGDGLGNSPWTTPTTMPAIDQGPFQPGEASKLMDPLAGVQCCHAKCTVKRVGRNCQQRMCRKHCHAAGGCSSNGHSCNGQPSESFRPTSPSDLHARAPTLPFRPASPSQLRVLSVASRSQLDPPLSLSHGSDTRWPSDRSHLCSPPPMSQIDPILCPPLSHNPDVRPLLADPLARSIPSELHINPLLCASAGSLLSTSSESSFSSCASPPAPVSSLSSSISLPKPHGDKEQQSQLPPSRPAMADASINPHYTSQLRPIFVEHVAEVHERAAQKHRRDQEVLQAKKKTHESVVVFSFPKNDDPPVTVEFQEGFTYPYFKLTEEVLDDLQLALSEAETSSRAVHFFNRHLDTWVMMKVNSVIDLTGSLQKLFFKGTHVTSYPSFDRHLEAAATPVSRPNPRLSLSQERSHVRRAQTMMQSHASSSLEGIIELTTDDDSGDSLPAVKLQKKSNVASGDDADVISLHNDDSFLPDPTQMTTTARLVPGVNATSAKFPSSYYAVNVHISFQFKSTNKLAVDTQFEGFFQLPWKSSTYYYHKSRWLNAPRDARDKAVNAGYTEVGQYTNFLAAHPAKDGELRAAKRKSLGPLDAAAFLCRHTVVDTGIHLAHQ
ncbi:hypothetical protein OG21DRAFT_1526472 [Imleria badia]|nr:hypothetical protein OG21DRAFT_1526472 [Imleria badia]